MKAWFETYRNRYERELHALEEADIDYQINDVALAQGILRLELHIAAGNKAFNLPATLSLDLWAVFPDNYPFFRPEVYAYDLAMPRHHNPFEKNLCLIPRGTEYWYPESTLAELLLAQLGKVIEKGKVDDVETLEKDEEEQAEPESEYYPVNFEGPILFDPSSINVMFDSDKIEFLGQIRVGVPNDAMSFPTRLIVLETADSTGKVVGILPEHIKTEFRNTIKGVLYKLPGKPPFGNLEKDWTWFQDELKRQAERIKFPGTTHRLNGKELINVIGLAFPDEINTPGKKGVGWIFMVYLRAKELIGDKKNPKSVPKDIIYYAKALRMSRDDLQVRIPKLRPLANHTIAIAGVGALGGPSAIELAKAGIKELRLLDFDLVEPGPTVRWPLGLSVAGKLKTSAIKKFIEKNFPETKVTIETLKIGACRIQGRKMPESLEESQHLVLDRFLEGASLLYDACAEIGVMNYLSFQARLRGIPYVNVYATQGAVGGSVMRVVPGKTEGCWMCLRLAIQKGMIPDAPFEQNGKVQATGCGDITFTGAGFDLQNIAMAGVRMVVGILCDEGEGTYPTLPDDVGILSLIDENGNPTFPKWNSYKLKKDSDCPYCNEEE